MTIQFSRVNPPRVLVPVNNEATGAHNELLPSSTYDPEPVHLIKRVRKRVVHQRRTVYEDLNKARETPLHPPYVSSIPEQKFIQGKSSFSTGPVAF